MGLLELNGLSPELLTELSYASQLGRSLKNNLDSFEKEALLQDALAAAEWLDINSLLAEVAIDYRIKSEESIRSKYERCYPHRPVIKTFNDILGFRSCCDDYREALSLARTPLLSAGQFSLSHRAAIQHFIRPPVEQLAARLSVQEELSRQRRAGAAHPL